MRPVFHVAVETPGKQQQAVWLFPRQSDRLLFGLLVAQDPQTQPSAAMLAHVYGSRAGGHVRVSMLAAG